MTSDSLIEKLEALKQQWGNHPDPCAVIDDIIAIVRQHQDVQPQDVRRGEMPVVDEKELKESIRKVVSLVCNTQQAAVKGMIDMLWLKISPHVRTPEPVSISLYDAAVAIEVALFPEKGRPINELKAAAKAVLDAAGVKYVD